MRSPLPARSLLLVGALSAAWIPSACSEPPPEPAPAPAPEYPAGTVLAVGGFPILADEVERFVPMISMIEPQFVRRDHLRKVLSNITLPTAAGASLLPDERQAAFQRAQALLAAARETGAAPADAPQVNTLSGPWVDVGMVSWFEAMDLEVGSWSELHETPGAWTFFQLVHSNAYPGEFDALTEITIHRYDVPYLPDEAMRDLIQDALDTLPIDVVDPEWEPLVPPLFLYRTGSVPTERSE